jgi:hypothetical protein
VLAGSRDSKIQAWDVLFERDSALTTREGDHQWSSRQFSPDGISYTGVLKQSVYMMHTMHQNLFY